MHDAIQWATLLHESSSFRSSRHIVGVIWLKADALRSIVVATEGKKAFKRQVMEEKRGPTSSAAIRKKSIGYVHFFQRDEDATNSDNCVN